MKSKICGLKYPENIKQLVLFQPDFMGFIFYKDSKRCIELNQLSTILNDIPEHIKKVGVFVNENIQMVIDTYSKFTLNYVQLHGDESIEYCMELKMQKIKIIKAFSIDDAFDFKSTYPYSSSCDYFLFDTKSVLRGGNGFAFNWLLLNNYKGETPFFLSGGIGINNIELAVSLKHEKLHAIDLNSKLESSIGLKDIELTKYCMNKILKN